MSYIYPAPGVANVEATLTLAISGATGNAVGNLNVPALQDVTINNSNDVFTWTQLDEGSKLQIATTATNSLAMNLVLDKTTFFGNAAANVNAATGKGIFGLSKDKSLVAFTLYMGDENNGNAGPTVSGNAYVTGLAPTVSADSPVWVSPITLTVTGDYTIS
jgi:hypothetical protein